MFFDLEFFLDSKFSNSKLNSNNFNIKTNDDQHELVHEHLQSMYKLMQFTMMMMGKYKHEYEMMMIECCIVIL